MQAIIMCLRVCHEISQTHYSLVLGSFKRKAYSFSLRKCNVALTCSAANIPPTKVTFLAMFCRFVRKPFEVSKLLQWTAFKSGQGLSKIGPQLGPISSFGDRKHEKIANNWIFHLQTISLCCDVSPIKNFQRQCCKCICLEIKNVDKCSNVMHIDAFYNDFSALKLTSNALFQTGVSPKRLHLCACLIYRCKLGNGIIRYKSNRVYFWFTFTCWF